MDSNANTNNNNSQKENWKPQMVTNNSSGGVSSGDGNDKLEQQQQATVPHGIDSASIIYDHLKNRAFIARLSNEENILLIREDVIEVGRDSSKSKVDFHVGDSRFVSRRHFIIQHDASDVFFLHCASKNGIFVDNAMVRMGDAPYQLPNECMFRFPNTRITIQFENLLHLDEGDMVVPDAARKTVIDPASRNVVYAPLQVAIPTDAGSTVASSVGGSGYPSPIGTMSAVNSCQPSPQHTMEQEYSIEGQNSINNASLNNNNNNNSNSSNNNYHHSEPAGAAKPPYSYGQLIVQAISSTQTGQLTLSGIYSYISETYAYYRTHSRWHNSIRHNLSLNRSFIKVPRSQDEPGKGCFWRIDPSNESKLVNNSYRVRQQRVVQRAGQRHRMQDIPRSHANPTDGDGLLPLEDMSLDHQQQLQQQYQQQHSAYHSEESDQSQNAFNDQESSSSVQQHLQQLQLQQQQQQQQQQQHYDNGALHMVEHETTNTFDPSINGANVTTFVTDGPKVKHEYISVYPPPEQQQQ